MVQYAVWQYACCTVSNTVIPPFLSDPLALDMSQVSRCHMSPGLQQKRPTSFLSPRVSEKEII